MTAGREINRKRWMSGTAAGQMRIFFVFGGLAFTFLMGTAFMFIAPDSSVKIRNYDALRQKQIEERNKRMLEAMERRKEIEEESKKEN